jgi:hypothetical protein
MLVYRLERRGGSFGVYKCGGPGNRAERNKYNHDQHPMPDEDLGMQDEWCGIYNKHDYYFGFESMESLQEWFPRENWEHFVDWNEEEKDSPRQQIVLCEYDVPRDMVVVGYKQLAFYKDRALSRRVIEEFKSVESYSVSDSLVLSDH